MTQTRFKKTNFKKNIRSTIKKDNNELKSLKFKVDKNIRYNDKTISKVLSDKKLSAQEKKNKLRTVKLKDIGKDLNTIEFLSKRVKENKKRL